MLHICFPSKQILVSSKNFPNCVNNKNCIHVLYISLQYCIYSVTLLERVGCGGDWEKEANRDFSGKEI